MSRPPAFGLNVDPNAGGLAIAARIAAIADASGLEYAGIAARAIAAAQRHHHRFGRGGRP
jgi:hypothetical protein